MVCYGVSKSDGIMWKKFKNRFFLYLYLYRNEPQGVQRGMLYSPIYIYDHIYSMIWVQTIDKCNRGVYFYYYIIRKFWSVLGYI